MNEKEVWLNIMEFVHDEETNCSNFAALLELTPVEKKNEKTALLIKKYLQIRSELGSNIKIVIDGILQGERKEK